MDVVLSYDVSTRHQEVRTALGERGFNCRYYTEDGTINLPNTVLITDDFTPAAAIAEFKKIVEELNGIGIWLAQEIEILRVVAFTATGILGDKGKPYAQ